MYRAIGIGGSAGAVRAIEALCAALPADLDAAVFIVLHVSPQGPGLLPDILNRRSKLPAELAQDGAAVAPGRIYVAPPDRHLLTLNGVLRLGRGPRENMARPAIDPLFRSLGVSYGARSVGVVLTGYLGDGACGLADLKRCGGVTVAQNPSDAEAAAMPLSALRASDIDYRADLDDIAPLVTTLSAQTPGPQSDPAPGIALELEIALGRPAQTAILADVATPAPLTCPACSGVLSQIGRPALRFRCQVGHSYSAESLFRNRDHTVEEAMRTALRMIEERAVLVEKLAAEHEDTGSGRIAQDFRTRAAEHRDQARIIRQAVLARMV